MLKPFTAAAVSVAVLSFAASASAQTGPAGDPPADPWSGFFAAGPGAVPEYDGSKDYKLIPFVVADVNRGPFTLEFRGLTARLDVLDHDNWSVGPLINFRGGRDDEIDGPVGQLDEIDGAIEAGAFVSYGFGGDPTGRGRISLDLAVMTDTGDAHEGTLATLGASYALVRTPQWFVDVGVSASYADDNFTETYFGITPAEATRTGFAAYTAEAGWRDAGIGVTGGYQFNERWGLIGRVGYSRLTGDAADSPLVADGVGDYDVGSRDQFMGGIALAYRF